MGVQKQVVVAQIGLEVLCSMNPAIEMMAPQVPNFLNVATVHSLVGQFHRIVLGVVPGVKNRVSQFR